MSTQEPNNVRSTAPQDVPASSTSELTDTYASAPTGMTKYNMYYTTSRLNVTFHEGLASTPAVYYAESESFTLKPYFFLRRGGSKQSPMVAFVKFHMTSRHMQIGRGDFKKGAENQLIWEDLKREKSLLCRSDYQFGTSIGSETGGRREYRWRKDKGKVASTVYECLDDEGKTVAKLFSGGALNWRKGGELDVLNILDQGLREILMASALGIWTMEAFNYGSLVPGYGKSDRAQDHEMR